MINHLKRCLVVAINTALLSLIVLLTEIKELKFTKIVIDNNLRRLLSLYVYSCDI